MLEVRLLNPSDLKNLKELFNQLFPVKYSMQYIQNLLSPNYLSLVIIDHSSDNKIVGVSISRRSWVNFFSTERSCYLSSFGIDRKYRRTSLGSDLLKITLNITFQCFGIKCVKLHTQKTNSAAIMFYQSIGFHPITVHPHYYNLPNTDPESDENVAIEYIIDTLPFETIQLKNDLQLNEDIKNIQNKRQDFTWLESFFLSP